MIEGIDVVMGLSLSLVLSPSLIAPLLQVSKDVSFFCDGGELRINRSISKKIFQNVIFNLHLILPWPP